MNRISLTTRALAAIIMVAMLATGCSRDTDSLLTTVPDSAQLIIVADADALLKNAGFQVTNGQYTNPTLSTNQKDIGLLCRLAPAIDMHNVVIAELSEGSFTTFAVTDADRLVELAKAEGFAKGPREGSLDTYSDGTTTVMTNGKQGWTTQSPAAVTEALQKAKQNTAAGNVGINQVLESDNDLKVASRIQGMPDQWVAAVASVKDNLLDGSVSVMSSQGKTLQLNDFFDVLSTDFLRYAPAETQLAIAVAIKPGVNWGALQNLLALTLGNGGRMVADMVLEQLKKTDGTVSIAFSPASGNPKALAELKPGAWDVTLMAHMPQSKVDATIDQLTSLASTMGIAVKPDGQGLYRANLSRIDESLGDVFTGTVDGYFTLATRRPDANENNSLTTTFEGKRAALYLNIPYQSPTMRAFDLPYGVNLQVQVETDRATFKMRFNGSDSAFLATVKQIFDTK